MSDIESASLETRPGKLVTPAGVGIAYDSIGTGKPVILLHGGGQTRHSWSKTAQSLAVRGYRAISIDARGHGESAWTERYSLPLFADDVTSLIHQLCPDQAPALIGASLGGLSAIVALGGDTPPPASALVLVDIAAKLKKQGTRKIRDFMAANRDGFASIDEAADAVAAYMTDRPRPRDTSGLARNLRERDGRYYWHWDPDFMTGGIDPDPDLERLDLDLPTARLALPVLLVRGELSNVIDNDSVAHFRKLVPHVETAEVPGAGHMVAGDANSPFAEAIIEFLAKHYPALTGDNDHE